MTRDIRDAAVLGVVSLACLLGAFALVAYTVEMAGR